MTTGKTIALTIWTFVGKMMSLLFNMLSQFVIDFLPKSKCLNLVAAVTICSALGTQENKIRITQLKKKRKTLAPWKKSYDQPSQYIKKQRHYFTNKGPSSQGCFLQ